MPVSPRHVNLLILTSRVEDAAEIIASLRNGGLPARGIYTDQSDRLLELTAAPEALDMILCCVDDPAVQLDQVISDYQEIEADIPLILLTEAEGQDPRRLLHALRNGARDQVERGDAERLQLLVARELADLRARRGLARTQEQIDRCEQQALELIEATEDAIAFIRDGIHQHANGAYRRRYRIAANDDITGLPLLDLVAPEHHATLREQLIQLAGSDPESLARHLLLTGVRADGHSFPAEFSLLSVEFGGHPCIRLIVRDTGSPSEQRADSQLDPDTGLENRAALIREVSRRLAQAADGDIAPFVLLYVGIPGFAEIAQSPPGFLQSFEVAAAFAAALGRTAPPHSLLARVADGGFMLLWDTTDPSDAAQLAVTIRHEVRLPLVRPDHDAATPECVTGFVFFDRPGPSPAELVDAAVANAFVATPPAERDPTIPRLLADAPDGAIPAVLDAADREIAERIDHALENDGLLLVYQPIISLLGDSQEHYSVLVRLLDDRQRLHEAREIIGPAVRSGKIAAVDRWVLDHAIKEVAAQRKTGHKIAFFINLAEETFLDTTFLLWLCDRLREIEARGNWLTLQFQEIHARRHLAKLTKLVEGFKKIQARIAISRFGQDPQPETLFQTLPIDFVLFSPEFAQDLNDDQEKKARLLRLANLAREFNVKTVVTGVEGAATLTVLWGAGIDYVQGNFLARASTSLTLNPD
ncbi:GGDEF domain-containing protein [Thioalkalicoccus limnaeus]|uniref:GGDEF domain-containing protein n=1 Tax=Thioalkalicoccus limnaeus TaxID=120681 RepID=A0ABV4BDA9_9GAMM